MERDSELLAGKKMKRRKAFFSISAVAEMFSVHQQTIRLYEREGLIQPKRSEGNTRLFSEEDVNKLEEVIYLTHKLGINLAGVQMILKLQRQIKKMQKDMNNIFEETKQDLRQQEFSHKSNIKLTSQTLAKLKKEELTELTPSEETDNWEIDYEEQL
ncbi:MAG: MerR family transcriptional regulator/heat shock protein HspR [Alteromonas naphthalenivorans]|jgi:MerR family transcriptional regulator/heat shock protein HspR